MAAPYARVWKPHELDLENMVPMRYYRVDGEEIDFHKRYMIHKDGRVFIAKHKVQRSVSTKWDLFAFIDKVERECKGAVDVLYRERKKGKTPIVWVKERLGLPYHNSQLYCLLKYYKPNLQPTEYAQITRNHNPTIDLSIQECVKTVLPIPRLVYHSFNEVPMKDRNKGVRDNAHKDGWLVDRCELTHFKALPYRFGPFIRKSKKDKKLLDKKVYEYDYRWMDNAQRIGG